MDWKELGEELSRACPGWEAAPEDDRLVLTKGPCRVEVYGDTVSFFFCPAGSRRRLPAAHCHPESEGEVREAAAWYLENAAPLGEEALRRRARGRVLLGALLAGAALFLLLVRLLLRL